jgi:hypothetical protein
MRWSEFGVEGEDDVSSHQPRVSLFRGRLSRRYLQPQPHLEQKQVRDGYQGDPQFAGGLHPHPESPSRLLERLKIGREEYCQRLLTMLVLDGPYPRWNTPAVPSSSGIAFLRTVYEHSFNRPWPGDDAMFVDEFALPPRHDGEAGGAPDYAVAWGDHLWLIELKTEKGSHRNGQIPGYFDLAHHHYPDAMIDVLYVTPAQAPPVIPPGPWAAYAHTTWMALAPHVEGGWPVEDGSRYYEIVSSLLNAIGDLGLSPAEWRSRMVSSSASEGVTVETADTPRVQTTALERAMHAAVLTAHDGDQRAVECEPADLDELLRLRLSVRNRLASSPPGSNLRRVLAWVWTAASAGPPRTQAGCEHGGELRLSRYKTPRY